MMKRSQRLLISVVVAIMVSALGAQSPRPTFEVASIKKLEQPATGLVFGSGPAIRNDTMRMTNSTLAALIQFGYGLRDFQVVGGPDWVSKDLFELQAKSAGEPSQAEMKLMLQSLLEDRFGLVMHKEQRDVRSFAMVPARGNGRPGPYLHRMPDTGPCDRKAFEEAEKARDKLSPAGRAMLGFNCSPLTNLAEVVSKIVGLPVLDGTGLAGRWGGTLYFASPPTVDMGPLGIRPTTATPNPDLPSFQTALQEQFGLKLETTRGPIDVMVIDSVRQPTEN